jgi:exodeoxyribonuclease V alpha subunit
MRKSWREAVFDVIEQEPPRVRQVTGIGPKRAERIIAGWAEQKIIREIMLFLHSNGVSTSRRCAYTRPMVRMLFSSSSRTLIV